MPPVVRDLVLGRLERLDASERLSVELMAVAGDAPPAVLAQVSGIRPEELDAAIGRLGELGLLVVEHPGTEVVFRVAHPLIAEVAYAELPEGRRRRPHVDLAAALEAVGIEDPQRLAHHYRGAAWDVDAGRALMVFIAAATAAEMVHADAEASDYLATALGLARIDQPVIVDELLERLGCAGMRAGHLESAVAAWPEAFPRAATCR